MAWNISTIYSMQSHEQVRDNSLLLGSKLYSICLLQLNTPCLSLPFNQHFTTHSTLQLLNCSSGKDLFLSAEKLHFWRNGTHIEDFGKEWFWIYCSASFLPSGARGSLCKTDRAKSLGCLSSFPLCRDPYLVSSNLMREHGLVGRGVRNLQPASREAKRRLAVKNRS